MTLSNSRRLARRPSPSRCRAKRSRGWCCARGGGWPRRDHARSRPGGVLCSTWNNLKELPGAPSNRHLAGLKSGRRSAQCAAIWPSHVVTVVCSTSMHRCFKLCRDRQVEQLAQYVLPRQRSAFSAAHCEPRIRSTRLNTCYKYNFESGSITPH